MQARLTARPIDDLSDLLTSPFIHNNPLSLDSPIVLANPMNDTYVVPTTQSEVHDAQESGYAIQLFSSDLRVYHQMSQAFKDSKVDRLTGALNKRGLVERLGDEVSKAHRNGNSILVVSIDLVGFKKVNDTYDHNEGDYVLNSISTILKSANRPTDLVARPGGDEFYLILTDVNPNATIIENIKERIYGKLKTTIPYSKDPKIRHQLDARLGFYLFTPKAKIIVSRSEIDLLAQDLISRADNEERKIKKDNKTGFYRSNSNQ